MGTIEQKFNYTFEAKGMIKDGVNALGGNLTDDNELKDYADELSTVWNNLPKVSNEGTEVTLTPTLKGKLGIVEKGNSTQEQQVSPNLYNVNDNMVFSGTGTGTVNADGSITWVVDNSQGTSTITVTASTNNLNIKPSTSYAIVTEILSVEGIGTLYSTNRNSNLNQGQFQSVSRVTTDMSAGDIFVDVVSSISSENMSTVTRGLRTALTVTSTRSVTITFRISVLEDTTITPQTFHYLPYGNLNPQPYFPIPIKSVTGNNNVVVSGNWFSSEMELGGLTNTGAVATTTDTNLIRTKDYIEVLPNTEYTIKNDKGYSNYTYYYDSSYTFIERHTGTSNPKTFITPANTKYLKVRTVAGNVENDLTAKFMLNLGSTALDWQQYSAIQTLPLNLGTKKMMLGDYIGNGNINHKRGVIQINTTNFNVVSGGKDNLFYLQNKTTTNFYGGFTGNCTHLKVINDDGITNANTANARMNDNELAFRHSTEDRFYIKSTAFTTVSDVETFIDNNTVYLEYELVTETTESLTEEQQAQVEAIDNMQSYNGTTIITSTFDSSNAQMISSVSALKGE